MPKKPYAPRYAGIKNGVHSSEQDSRHDDARHSSSGGATRTDSRGGSAGKKQKPGRSLTPYEQMFGGPAHQPYAGPVVLKDKSSKAKRGKKG